MADQTDNSDRNITGTSDRDDVVTGGGDDKINVMGGDDVVDSGAGVDDIDGGGGSDTLTGGTEDDLIAAGHAGGEWSYVNGKWTFDASKLNTAEDAYYTVDTNDNTLIGETGDDVLLGARGKDTMIGGEGDDRAYGGRGDDAAFGGTGNDLLNLEAGNDYAEGGFGADTINGGAGNDVIYGDNSGNLLADDGGAATSMAQHGNNGWVFATNDDGNQTMCQSIDTEAGETYSLTFDLAANLAGGATHGAVKVIWNGEVIDTLQVDGGAYESHTIEFTGIGGPGELLFETVTPEDTGGPDIDMSGPIFSYEKTVEIGGEEATISAFAPGQAKLFQMIDGTLKVFDTESQSYTDAGDPTGLKINAMGFNAQDDLLYGIAKQAGTDALGNEVSVKDIVMVDADGNAYKVGTSHYGDFVGDFDDQGNLWTFNNTLNRVTKIDVDNLDANGEPTVQTYHFPKDLVTDKIYDIAFNPKDNSFYGVVSSNQNGGAGKVLKVDMSNVESGGDPIVSTIPINGTLVDGQMEAGMAKGAYGAVFIDGEGNLYGGLNSGDHDLDGYAPAKGGIYRINIDDSGEAAYGELLSEAQRTGANDGAADPRAPDPFAEVDDSADILISAPKLEAISGGNDDLRGGDGDDLMHGGAGSDTLHGGNDDDTMHGDSGDDKIYGGEGDDVGTGGTGNDHLLGQAGDDSLDGGEGRDYLNGGTGDDILRGGAGVDKIVGGSGSDTIEGGAGDDHLWGGNWWKDGSSDTFVISAGSGRDMIHDFEIDKDVIDLSAYGLEFDQLQHLIQDRGWATEIDLSVLDGASPGDSVVLKSIDPNELDESNFIL